MDRFISYAGILGHESVATTEIYTRIDEHQLQSVVNSNPLDMMFN